MELKQLLSKFVSGNTEIRVASIEGVMYKGPIKNATQLIDSNLEVIDCNITDNVLSISVAI